MIVDVFVENTLIKLRKTFNESRIFFQSESLDAIKSAIKTIKSHRRKLEEYILLHPRFLHSLKPICPRNNAPLIVKKMVEPTKLLHVGPMAAVAGALADLAVQAMVDSNAECAIVEDGGEVSAITTKEAFNVGLYAGRTGLGKKVGFRIHPSDCPIGIGTSSATISHAFSFGEADAVTIFANNAAFADAAATAVCNRVRGTDVEDSIHKGLNYVKTIDFIRGAIIVRGEYVGSIGKIPKLININNT